jgi:mycofactocin system creatininase family protein
MSPAAPRSDPSSARSVVTAAHLAARPWPEVEQLAAAGAMLVLPIGSTEQHGPHLPLSTDTDIAVALADRLAEARADVLVAPPVSYGSSGEHAGFAGTISIGRAALELLLVEWGRSATQTFSRLVFINGHGGNVEPVAAAARLLQQESRHVVVWGPHWQGDAHAGHVETSIQLALSADRVRIGRACVGNVTPVDELLPLMQAAGVRAVSPNGVLGDPTGATAEDGVRLLDRLTDDLIATVDHWYPRLDDQSSGDAA